MHCECGNFIKNSNWTKAQCINCWRQFHVKPPTLAQKAVNLAGAVVRHVSNGGRRVPLEVAQQRLAVCDGCEYLNKERRSCDVCGCYVNEKTAWASEKCPKDKWGVYEITTPANGGCRCGKK